MRIAVIMGSNSDYTTMVETCKLLDEFEIPYDKKVVSAHRTPDLLVDFSKNAKKKWLQFDYSSSWRCSTSSWNGSIYDYITSYRSTY